jgi:Matrixin
MGLSASNVTTLGKAIDALGKGVGLSEGELTTIDTALAALKGSISGQNPAVAAGEFLLATAAAGAIVTAIGPELLVGATLSLGEALLGEGTVAAIAAEAEAASEASWLSLSNGTQLVAKTTYVLDVKAIEALTEEPAHQLFDNVYNNIADMLTDQDSVSTSNNVGSLAVNNDVEAVFGNASEINVTDNGEVAISGADNTVSLATGTSAIDMGGGADTINGAPNSTVVIAGNGQDGPSDQVNIASGTVVLGDDANVNVSGANNTLTGGANDSLAASGDNEGVTLGSGGTDVWLDGGGDSVNSASDPAAFDSVFVSGNGQWGADNSIHLSNGWVSISGNARADVAGFNDSAWVASDDAFGVTGSNNSISAAANSDVWMDSKGNTTYLNGGGDQVNDPNDMASGDSVFVSGNGQWGADNSIYLSNGWVSVSANARADVAGSNDSAWVASDDALGVTGSNNSISAAANSDVWMDSKGNTTYLNGGGDQVNDPNDMASGDSVFVSGNGQWGPDNSIYLSNGWVSVSSEARADISGSNDTAWVNSDDALGVTGSNEQLTLGSNADVWLNGGGDQVNTASHPASSDSVNVEGNGQWGADNSVYLSNGWVSFSDDARADIAGSDDAIWIGSDDTMGISGADNTLNASSNSELWMNGAGDTAYLNGGGDQVNDPDHVASGDSVVVADNGQWGADDSVYLSDGWVSVDSAAHADLYGSGDAVWVSSDDSFGVTGDDVQINAESDSNVWVNKGTNDTVMGGSGDTVYIGDEAYGTMINVSNGNVVLGSNDNNITIQGDNDSISGGTGDVVQIKGTSDPFGGNNDQVDYTGDSNDGDTVTGSGDVVSGAQAGGSTGSTGSDTLSQFEAIPGMSDVNYDGTYAGDDTFYSGDLDFNYGGYAFTETFSGGTVTDVTESDAADGIYGDYNISSGIETITVDGETYTYEIGSDDASPVPSFGFAGNRQNVFNTITHSAGSTTAVSLATLDSEVSNDVHSAVLEGVKWESRVVTWTAGSLSLGEGAAVETALSQWSAASGLVFDQVSSAAQPDITIQFGDLNTQTTGVIGLTTYSARGSSLEGGVTVILENPSQDPLVAGSAGDLTYAGTDASFGQVILHELGHALGLGDNTNSQSIMDYYLGDTNRGLSGIDEAAVALLYSPNTGAASEALSLASTLASLGGAADIVTQTQTFARARSSVTNGV